MANAQMSEKVKRENETYSYELPGMSAAGDVLLSSTAAGVVRQRLVRLL